MAEAMPLRYPLLYRNAETALAARPGVTVFSKQVALQDFEAPFHCSGQLFWRIFPPGPAAADAGQMNEPTRNWPLGARRLMPGDIERMVTKKCSGVIGYLGRNAVAAKRLLQSGQRQAGPVNIGAVGRDLAAPADKAAIVGCPVVIEV